MFNQIIDANNNCIDQVASQMESILVSVIGNFEIARAQGRQVLDPALENQAAYDLFKHKINLIKEICVREYPFDPHMPTFERVVKEELFRTGQVNPNVLAAGAQYAYMIDRSKVNNVVSIFQRGIALQATRPRHDYTQDQFKPEEYFRDQLKIYHGAASRSLRANLLIWARDYFNLEADDEQTREFITAISVDPNGLTADQGGNFKDAALLYYLELIGVLERGPRVANRF